MDDDEKRAEIARLRGELDDETAPAESPSPALTEEQEAAKTAATMGRRFGIGCLGLIGVFVLLIWIASVSGDDPPRQALPAAESSADAGERIFLQTVRAEIPASEVSDAIVLLAGREVCAALSRGVDPLEVYALAIEEAPGNGAVIMGAAAGALCREHLPAVQELADTLG